jgi:ABC-type sugar transport system ATPase subunit
MVNILLNHVTLHGKGAEKETLIDNIFLEIKAGEFVTLVGPTNSGKSRILRIIAGLTEPSYGEVLFSGKNLTEFSPNYEKMAMVFQSQALYPHLTVRKNLEFGLKLANLPRETIQARVTEIADLLDINIILDKYPRALPDSQKQLVAIARAFVKRPQVLIFDEPISELDSKLKAKIQSLIRRFCINLQATVVYATHNPGEAMTLGDRIICLDNGKVQQIGTNHELYNNPANEIVARFIAYPEMNFIEFEAKTENNQSIMNLTNASYSIEVPKVFEKIIESYSKAKIGVRAENLKIVSEKPNTIPMIVEMQEYFGSQSILHVSRNHQTLAVEISLNERYELGETVHVEMAESGIHLFADGKFVI